MPANARAADTRSAAPGWRRSASGLATAQESSTAGGQRQVNEALTTAEEQVFVDRLIAT